MEHLTSFIDFFTEYGKHNKILTKITAIYVYSEREIETLLRMKCANPNKMVGFLFKPKVEICYAFGLIHEPLHYNLQQLNTLRNHFAHKNSNDFSHVKENNLTFRFLQRNGKYLNKNLKKLAPDEILDHIMQVTIPPLYAITSFEATLRKRQLKQAQPGKG